MTVEAEAFESAETRERAALLRREIEQPRWTNPPNVGIVFSSENWDQIEPLVNDLRYELTDHYNFSPINIKVTQTESIIDIPLYVNHFHHRSDIVFALGVMYRTSPDYEQRLVDLFTERISATSSPGRLPVFDCILVRDNQKQLEAQLGVMANAESSMASGWARRAIDAYMMLSKPAI
ncbi:hypothetical protein H4S08_000833 [Coemansia sp. RSA 1365]|nr:hypothetical protein H4S08_000833 [Coemansia sp. RSA 1365]